MADLILGNTTVMTESGGTVTLNEGTLGSAVNLASVTFPAGHPIQYQVFKNTTNGQNATTTWYYYGINTGSSAATGTPIGQITLKQANSKLLVEWTGVMTTGSHNTGTENNIITFIRYSINNDLSSSTEKQIYYNYSDMRSGGDLPGQTIMTKTGKVILTLSNSANDIYYFGIKDTKYGWSAGWTGSYGEGNVLTITEIQQ